MQINRVFQLKKLIGLSTYIIVVLANVMLCSMPFLFYLVEAMMNIKTEYQVEKNWMGDPCLPEKYTWVGLKCKSDGFTSRVKTL